MNNRKGIAHVVIALVLIGLVTGIFYFGTGLFVQYLTPELR